MYYKLVTQTSSKLTLCRIFVRNFVNSWYTYRIPPHNISCNTKLIFHEKYFHYLKRGNFSQIPSYCTGEHSSRRKTFPIILFHTNLSIFRLKNLHLDLNDNNGGCMVLTMVLILYKGFSFYVT